MNTETNAPTLQGLRILARIIAREEIKKQLAEGDKSYGDVSLPETVPAKAMELAKGAKQTWRIMISGTLLAVWWIGE